jgi:hypothetical protein
MDIRLPHIPKIRTAVDLAPIDGSVLTGHVFI